MSETLDHHIIPQNEALNFILGGNALFTLVNKVRGTRFTYKILQNSKNERQFKVSMMNGTDNTKDYRMIGTIDLEFPNIQPLGIHTKDFPAFKALDYVYLNLQVEMSMQALEIWHHGRCGRCGRILTVPESIANGIGPECIKKEKAQTR